MCQGGPFSRYARAPVRPLPVDERPVARLEGRALELDRVVFQDGGTLAHQHSASTQCIIQPSRPRSTHASVGFSTAGMYPLHPPTRRK